MTRTALVVLSLMVLQLSLLPSPSSGSDPPGQYRLINAVDGSPGAIVSQRLEVSGSGIPHIAYLRFDGNEKTVLHASLVGGEWRKDVLWKSSGEYEDLSNLDMALDGETVYIAFTYTSWPMMISYLSQSTEDGWKTRSVGTDCVVVGLKVANGIPELVVGNYTAIVRMKAVQYGWDREIIMEYEDYPVDLTAGFRKDGSVYLTYIDRNDSLHVAERKGGSLSDEVVSDLPDLRYYDGFELNAANDEDVITCNMASLRHTYLLEMFDGAWEVRELEASTAISNLETGPDGSVQFLQVNNAWGVNLTVKTPSGLSSDQLWSQSFLSQEDMVLFGFGHLMIEQLQLAFSRDGTPHISYVNSSGIGSYLEYSTWTDDPPENLPPVIELTATPRIGKAPVQVTVDANVSDHDGEVLGSVIDLDYDSQISDIWTGTLHTIGTHTAYVMAWDDDLASTVASVAIEVLEPTLRVDITSERYSGDAPLEIDLTAAVSGADGNATEVKWTPLCTGNFSEPGPFTLRCRFTEPGEKVIFVSVRDGYGSEAMSYVTIEVRPGTGEDGLLDVLVPIIALLLVPLLFSAAAAIATGIAWGEGPGTDRPRQGPYPAPGSVRGSSRYRGAPPAPGPERAKRGPR